MRSNRVRISRAILRTTVSTAGILAVVIAAGCNFGQPAPKAPSAGDVHEPYQQCPADYQLDDMEDGNNQIATVKGRGGYWYTYADEKGTKVNPPPGSEGGQFAMKKKGHAKSKGSACMKGHTAASGDTLFAGMGFNFEDPKGPYDASAYKGVSFWAKSSSGATVRVKFPDVNTDPDGKKCSGCYNDFGFDLKLTDEWEQYTLPWELLKQEKGWGAPRPNRVSFSGIFAMQFQVKGAGVAFDVCVDDIQFIGCKDKPAGGDEKASAGAKDKDDDE